MNRFKTLAIALAVVGLVAPATSHAAETADRDKDKDEQRADRSAYVAKHGGGGIGDCSLGVASADLDANNVRARMYNTGGLFWRGGAAEYEIPRGSGLTSIFASGIWIGGEVSGELRVAWADYGDWEFWPGPLGPEGEAPTRATCQQFDRFWKISQDDIDQYLDSGATTNDLLTWPASLGAPVITSTANGLDDDGDGLVDEGFDNVDNDGDEKIDERDEQEFVDASAPDRAGNAYDLANGDLPDIIGTQTIWWIMNDRGNAHLNSDTAPIGLEVAVQAFAFATSNAINNTTFYKYNLRYKGQQALQNTYLGVWSDPDLGDYEDDYVGSDPELGLGFVYNSDDDDEVGASGYGTRPPALGYDYFQGPLVGDGPGSPFNDGIDNDGDGEIDEPNERLALSTFVYYNNGGGAVQGDPQNGVEVYNFLRAIWRNGQPVTFGFDGTDESQPRTTVMFPANPPEYWSEYDSDPAPGAQPIEPGDRRFLIASGPFTINPNDSQEIVFGIVWSQAGGGGALGSLQKLKNDDALAQSAFDNDFEVPRPPDAPVVVAQPLDGAVALTWSNPRTSNNYLNSYDVFNPFSDPSAEDRTYTLEGYEVFQLDSPAQSVDQGVLLAAFDRINGVTTVIDTVTDAATGLEVTAVVATGRDNGLQNSYTVRGLVNNQTYFFAVRAYAFNDRSNRQRIYSSPVLFGTNLISAVPSQQGSVAGGSRILSETGDLISTTVTNLDARQPFQAQVVNPGVITGATYEVRFVNTEAGACTPDDDTDDTPNDASDDVLIYNVFNMSTGDRVFDGVDFFCRTGRSPISNQLDEDDQFIINDQVPVIDGIQLAVAGLTESQVTLYSEPGQMACGDITAVDPLINNDATTPRPLQRMVFEDLSGTRQLPLGTVVRFYNGPEAPDTLSFPTYEARPVAYNFVETVRPGGGAACGGGGNQQGCDQSDGVWVYAEGRSSRGTFSEDIVGAGLNGGANSTGAYHVTALGAGPEDSLDDFAPNEIELRMTGSSYTSHFFQEGSGISTSTGYTVPFEVWDIGNVAPGTENDPADDVRLIPVMFSDVFSNNISNGAQIEELCNGFVYEDPTLFNNEPPNPITDRIYAFQASTGMTYEDFAAATERILFPYQNGTVIQINTADFAAVRGDAEAEQTALDQIAAVPNPYRGASEYETSANDRQIRFVNLPSSATIRIFTISGTLVREIVKPTSNSTIAFWDLENQRGLPVASGMYLVHVEARNPSGNVIGERVLKLGVVQRRPSIDIL